MTRSGHLMAAWKPIRGLPARPGRRRRARSGRTRCGSRSSRGARETPGIPREDVCVTRTDRRAGLAGRCRPQPSKPGSPGPPTRNTAETRGIWVGNQSQTRWFLSATIRPAAYRASFNANRCNSPQPAQHGPKVHEIWGFRQVRFRPRPLAAQPTVQKLLTRHSAPRGGCCKFARSARGATTCRGCDRWRPCMWRVRLSADAFCNTPRGE